MDDILIIEEEAKRTQLMVNLLQDMLPKGDKLKMEVKQEPEPHNNQVEDNTEYIQSCRRWYICF